jgi:hypothetical protein
VPPASGNFVAILFVTVVAKFGSSPSAAANSLRVSRVPGAASTRFEIAVFTYV